MKNWYYMCVIHETPMQDGLFCRTNDDVHVCLSVSP